MTLRSSTHAESTLPKLDIIWCCKRGKNLKAYSSNISEMIEKSYQARISKCTVSSTMMASKKVIFNYTEESFEEIAELRKLSNLKKRTSIAKRVVFRVILWAFCDRTINNQHWQIFSLKDSSQIEFRYQVFLTNHQMQNKYKVNNNEEYEYAGGQIDFQSLPKNENYFQYEMKCKKVKLCVARRGGIPTEENDEYIIVNKRYHNLKLRRNTNGKIDKIRNEKKKNSHSKKKYSNGMQQISNHEKSAGNCVFKDEDSEIDTVSDVSDINNADIGKIPFIDNFDAQKDINGKEEEEGRPSHTVFNHDSESDMILEIIYDTDDDDQESSDIKAQIKYSECFLNRNSNMLQNMFVRDSILDISDIDSELEDEYQELMKNHMKVKQQQQQTLLNIMQEENNMNKKIEENNNKRINRIKNRRKEYKDMCFAMDEKLYEYWLMLKELNYKQTKMDALDEQHKREHEQIKKQQKSEQRRLQMRRENLLFLRKLNGFDEQINLL